jgi:hypothetical protein
MNPLLKYLIVTIFVCPLISFAQRKQIRTAVPFMLIAPDPRSTGIGDAGTSTKPDVYSMALNAAKYAFLEDQIGVGLSYTPWQRAIVEDRNLLYLTAFFKTRERETIATSLRYFSLGTVYFSDPSGNEAGQYNPSELAFDFAYIRKLFTNLSTSTTFRYLHSGLRTVDLVDGNSNRGNSIAADIGVYYIEQINNDNLSIGMQVSNMGTKMLYGSELLPLPCRASLGLSYTFGSGSERSIAVSSDISKLLISGSGSAGYAVSTGIELFFLKALTIRGGYHNASDQKYFTAGLAIAYKKLSFETSRLFSAQQFSTTQNTTRFGLAYIIR